MPRDPELERLVRGDLGPLPDLATTTMFGGLAWMWRGNLLCAVRSDGILLRLGKGNDDWALDLHGVGPMTMGARAMQGWVRIDPDAAQDGDLRRRLLDAARAFVAGLPAK